MKAESASVLRLAGMGAGHLEISASDVMQDAVNSFHWSHETNDDQVLLLMHALAVRASVADLTIIELPDWGLGYIRDDVHWPTSGRMLYAGDIVICNNKDDDGILMAFFRVWAPRLIHRGLLNEDQVDPL